MPNSENIELGFVIEASEDTNPGGTLQLVHCTGATIENSRTEINSATMNQAKGTKVAYGGNASAGLTVPFEWIFDDHDEEMRSLLRGNYETALNVTASTISAVASDNSLNGSGGTEFSNAVPGQIVRISGFTGAAGNNGYAIVTSKPTNAKIIIAGITLVDDAAGESVTVKGTVMNAGDTQVTLWGEYHNIDEDLYRVGRTVAASGQFTASIDAIMTGSFTHVVKGWTESGASAYSGTTAAPAAYPVDSVNHLAAVFIDNAVSTKILTSIDFTISNKGQGFYGLGDKSYKVLNTYGCEVSGTIEVYHQDSTFNTKQENNTPFSLGVVMEDPAGNATAFYLPQCRLTGESISNPGEGGIVTVSYGFSAFVDPTLDFIVNYNKISA